MRELILIIHKYNNHIAFTTTNHKLQIAAITNEPHILFALINDDNKARIVRTDFITETLKQTIKC